MYTSISGFKEYTVAEQITFNKIIDVIRKHFELSGAVPIETPAVERLSTLLSKGGNEKEIYGLRRVKTDDNEGDDATDLALRFDLTVPFARYVFEHSNDLSFPFKRYQIQPVWRGERPQKGRYRQFYQCDIDVVGNGKLSLINDAEMPYVIYRIFKELEIGHFTIRLNNRKVFTGFLRQQGIIEDNDTRDVLRIVDGIEKIGINDTKMLLLNKKLSEAVVDSLLDFFSLELATDDLIEHLESISDNEVFKAGVEELATVVRLIREFGVPDDYFKLDLKVARGLDYYTGTIYETRLTSHEGIGSICSGGRYDRLLEQLGSQLPLPGVGISIGISRLFPALIDINALSVEDAHTAPVLITQIDSHYLGQYLRMATALRNAGIGTEFFTEDKKLSAQMKYANNKGFLLTLIAGDTELEKNEVVIRRMEDGEQFVVNIEELVEKVKGLLTK